MVQIVQLCGYFAIVFAISIGLSYLLTSVRLKKRVASVVPGSVMQLRLAAVFIDLISWHKPFGLDHKRSPGPRRLCSLRVGENLTVLAPTAEGLKHFNTEIVLRDSETHELTPNCSEPGVAIVITRQAATSEASNAERERERGV